MAEVSRTRILQLYKVLLREGSKFTQYNYREYAKRRIQDAFRENRNETNEQRLKELVKKAEDNIAMLRRVTVVSEIYASEPLVLERADKVLQAGNSKKTNLHS